MSRKDDVRDFLISRRAAITPAQAGIRDDGRERRVIGLRREEVAELAGVSLDYYTRLERGNLRGVSDSILTAIAHALQLSDVETQHLTQLAAHAQPGAARRAASQRPAATSVRTSVQRVLGNLNAPAVVYNTQQDIVDANLLGRALYSPHLDTDRQPNIARFIFLDPRAQTYYADWPGARRTMAAILRSEAGRDPLNAALTALVGELSTLSAHFRNDWAEYEVTIHRTGLKTINHPQVGALEVTFDVFELPGEDDLSIVTYSVEPETQNAERLELLAIWATTNADHTAR